MTSEDRILTDAERQAGLFILAPCPFCGGQVQIDDPDAWKRRIGFRIFCDPCYVSMWAFKGQTPGELIARWNARGTSTEKDQ